MWGHVRNLSQACSPVIPLSVSWSIVWTGRLAAGLERHPSSFSTLVNLFFDGPKRLKCSDKYTMIGRFVRKTYVSRLNQLE